MSTDNKIAATEPEKLFDRITAEFPQFIGQSYHYIGEGWDHEVLIINESVVFRFPNDEEYKLLLKREIEVVRRLKPMLDIDIPSYSYISLDYSFAGYEIVKGQTLTKKYFDSLNAIDHNKIALNLAGMLSVMHRALENGHDFNMVASSTIVDDHKLLIRQVEQYLQPVLSKSDNDFVMKILNEMNDVLSGALPSVFLHGDIYYSHLLWDEKIKKLGVIDFSDMNRGDPAFDFAELYEYGKDFVHQVYELYSGPKDANFLKRAWSYQKWVGVFLMVDHFIYHKTSFEVACLTFERCKRQEKTVQNDF